MGRLEGDRRARWIWRADRHVATGDIPTVVLAAAVGFSYFLCAQFVLWLWDLEREGAGFWPASRVLSLVGAANVVEPLVAALLLGPAQASVRLAPSRTWRGSLPRPCS